MIGDIILGLLEGLAVVIFSGSGQTQQITDETDRTYFSYASQPIGAVNLAALTERGPTVPGSVRQINANPATRIPDMAFVPTYHTTVAATVAPDLPPYEVYCIRRPAQGFRWPQAPQADVAALAQTRPNPIPGGILSLGASQTQLMFQIKVDRTSPYRWTIRTPRMSVDIVSTTAVDAVDQVTIANPGTGSQAMTLLSDSNAGARTFSFAITGWPGNYGSDSKVYSLKGLTLHPGSSLIAGLSDGGKELWVHSPGAPATFTLEMYAGAAQQPAITKPNVTLDAGKIVRIRPSDWSAAKVAAADVNFDTVDANGQLVKHAIL